MKDRLVVFGVKVITLKKICNIMGIEVPERFKSIQHRVNNKLTMKKTRIKEGGYYFILFDRIFVKRHLDDAVKRGAKVIFMDRREFERSGLSLDDYPVILLDNKIEQVGAVFSAIKDSFNLDKTLAITGTVGKTTTKNFVYQIVKDDFRTYVSKENLNSYMAVGQHILRNLYGKELLIQETGAGGIDSVKKSAVQLKPDAFILLNVKGHHLENYKTFENLFKDKVCMDDYLPEDGVVIANFDDRNIAAHKFKHDVISFGVNCDAEVDYRAVNITTNREFIEFDVVGKYCNFHLKIAIVGVHNVYNILPAIAFAKWMGMSDDRIKERLEDYQSVGIRQNLQNVGGRYLLLDCYNACEDSIAAAVESVANFDLDDGGQRIVVIGGENALGDRTVEVHKRIGKNITNYDFDKIAFLGTNRENLEEIKIVGDAHSMWAGASEAGRDDAALIENFNSLVEYLSKNVNVGDITLLKCQEELNAAMAVDKVFGTSFSYRYHEYIVKSEKLEENGWKARVIPILDEVELTSPPRFNRNICIPDEINDFKVIRLRDKMFKKSNIKSIEFGNSLKNIGIETFAKCNSLKAVNIPENVRVLERGAFSNCESLTEVVINEGVTHIDKDCFMGCKKLKAIKLPLSVNYIGNGAFEMCPNVKILCKKGSFAEAYALEHKIETIVEDIF